MNKKIIILLLIIFPSLSFATGQIPDILIFKGDTLSLFSNPLEQYLEKKNIRAINHYVLEGESTACYRGYIATWEIRNGNLFLIKIEYCHKNSNNIRRRFDFVKEFGEKDVLAKWYNGKILAVSGKRLAYIDGAYNSVYEKEIKFSISNGNVKNQETINNSNSNVAFFSPYQNAFEKFIYSNLNWNRIPDLGTKTKTIFIEYEISNSKENLEKIIIKNESFFYNQFEKEIIKVLKKRPDWNLYKRDKKVWEIIINRQIDLNEEIRRKYGFLPPEKINYYVEYIIALLFLALASLIFFKKRSDNK